MSVPPLSRGVGRRRDRPRFTRCVAPAHHPASSRHRSSLPGTYHERVTPGAKSVDRDQRRVRAGGLASKFDAALGFQVQRRSERLAPRDFQGLVSRRRAVDGTVPSLGTTDDIVRQLYVQRPDGDSSQIRDSRMRRCSGGGRPGTAGASALTTTLLRAQRAKTQYFHVCTVRCGAPGGARCTDRAHARAPPRLARTCATPRHPYGGRDGLIATRSLVHRFRGRRKCAGVIEAVA